MITKIFRLVFAKHVKRADEHAARMRAIAKRDNNYSTDPARSVYAASASNLRHRVR